MTRAILLCDECAGIGCHHCDHQGAWEGDWRCDCCEGLLPASEAFCVSCGEMMTGHAGEQASAAEFQADLRARSDHLGRTLERHTTIHARLWPEAGRVAA